MELSNVEYDILEECYFLTQKSKIKTQIELADETLDTSLNKLWGLGYLRLYEKPDGKEFSKEDRIDWESVWISISKQGLVAHTTG